MPTLTAALLTTHLLCTTCNDGSFSSNQLVAAEWHNLVVGTMINSYYDRSYIGAYNFNSNTNTGVYVGIATGYPVPYGVIPVFAPYYTHGPIKLALFGEAVVLALDINITDLLN